MSNLLRNSSFDYLRADVLLSRELGVSRSVAKKLFDDGRVVMGEGVLKASAVVRPGEVIEVRDGVVSFEDAAKSSGVIGDPLVDFGVLYEDDDVVVVNKPAGLVVHPGIGVEGGTLVNGLVARYPEIVGVGEGRERPGIVHRLDRDTSGVIVVARNTSAYYWLKRQFGDRLVKKTYFALVVGKYVRSHEGRLEGWLVRSGKDGNKYVVVDKRVAQRKRSRWAALSYRVVGEYVVRGEVLSLVEVDLETGRKHQIRAQFASDGHPVVGDERYAFKGMKDFGVGRQFLHAARLEFVLPRGVKACFYAPLPQDLRLFLDEISV